MISTALPSRGTRIAVQALVALGGVAALSWEVIWQLQASLAIGVSALATAIILATTMAGMTTGSLVAGRWLRTRKLRSPLELYGNLELAVGASGLYLLYGFELIEALDGRVYAISPAFTPVFQAIAIALLVGIPTFAMGATIPVFVRISQSFGIPVAHLYGINTLGAACGVLLIAFLLIRSLGVAATCGLVAGINILVLVGTVVLNRRIKAASGASADEEPDAEATRISLRVASLLAFATGFVTFALEVAWFRALRAAFQSTTESFAIMLVAVLLALGVGARLVPHLRRMGVQPGSLLALAGFGILLATPLVERMDAFAYALRFPSYDSLLLQWLGLCLAILSPPVLVLGMVLPWCLEEFRDPVRAGWLYGLNTVGAVFGSVIAAWVLLPGVGFARSAWILALGLLLLATVLQTGVRRLLVFAAGAACLAVAVTQNSDVGGDRIMGYNTLSGHKLLAYDEGPDSTAAVVEEQDGIRYLMIDGFRASSESGLSDYMEWMGRLPMLAHPNPEEALVICFGTGRTANAVREEGPAHLDVAELSPAVLGMARHFPMNRGVLEDPRVRAIAMDGRAWLRRNDQLYDIVTLEPMPPHFAGMNALYSQDFYQIVARRLEPGGIVAQWLPLHLLPPHHSASVAATFQSVFPDSLLWIQPKTNTGILLGRLGGGGEPLGVSWPGLEGRGEQRPASADLVGRSVVLHAEELRRYAAFGQVITDDNQALAYGMLRRDGKAIGPGMAKLNLKIISRAAAPGEGRSRSRRAPSPD